MDQAASDYVLAVRVLHTGSIIMTHAVGDLSGEGRGLTAPAFLLPLFTYVGEEEFSEFRMAPALCRAAFLRTGGVRFLLFMLR
jgi:hypothetical protein